MNKTWKNNKIQYPRLLAELQMAGAFTPDIINLLVGSMDLSQSEMRQPSSCQSARA